MSLYLTSWDEDGINRLIEITSFDPNYKKQTTIVDDKRKSPIYDMMVDIELMARMSPERQHEVYTFTLPPQIAMKQINEWANDVESFTEWVRENCITCVADTRTNKKALLI